MANYTVVTSDGKWGVKKDNSQRQTSTHKTQGEAVQKARDLVIKSGGGEVRIQRRDSKFRSSNTVRRGK